VRPVGPERFGRRQICGVEAVAAALDAGSPIALLLVKEGVPSLRAAQLVERAAGLGIPVLLESEREMRRMTARETEQELLALAGPDPAGDLDTLMARPGVVFLLVGLRYPGNVGFILRSVEVAGGAGIVLESDWQQTQRDEALRIGMRPDRFLSVLYADAAEALESARRAGRRVVAVETSGQSLPWEANLSAPLVLVIGGEASGIPSRLLEQVDEVVRIPIAGFIPSYNVQAAVGIVLGEWLRQNNE
jgi:tRNA G18 (ribose-2'-O)-methylase SpoU